MPLTCWKKQDSCISRLCSKTCCKRGSKVNKINVERISPDTKPPIPNLEKSGCEEENSNNNEDEELTWQTIARVVDKLFFLIFIIAIVLSTVIVFGILLGEFVSVASE